MKKNIKGKIVTQKRVKRLIKRKSIVGIREERKSRGYINIIAKKNYRITEEKIKAIKNDLLTPKGLTEGKLLKLFKIKFNFIPNKSLTRKGILTRMGRGKGKSYTHGFYLTPGFILINLIPKSSNLSLNLINKLLFRFCLKYSFLSFLYLP